MCLYNYIFVLYYKCFFLHITDKETVIGNKTIEKQEMVLHSHSFLIFHISLKKENILFLLQYNLVYEHFYGLDVVIKLLS